MIRKTKTMDGNEAAASIAYAYSEIAALYPITPSSTMAEYMDEWSSKNKSNLFGSPVYLREMQSEAGAVAAMHGALTTGALATTFTSSQGLLLMIPTMYKMAGELLPGVFHVAARTIATHALSIFGDHSDIYACRQTGVAMLSTGSVQEIMDLAPIAHICALKSRIPFLHFFDGFRTSHELQKIHIWDQDTLKTFLDNEALQKFKNHSLSPTRAKMMGSAQNPDIYFQAKEASNSFYDGLPDIVEEAMQQINQTISSDYHLFRFYGDPNATKIIIAMGSVCETLRETVDFLNAHGERTGFVQVHLYRPFSISHFLKVLPPTLEKITVLDRTKEAGALGEPLYLDILAALQRTSFSQLPLYSGRYGLSSKNTTPSQLISVFENMNHPYGKTRFTIGIIDDVTHLSLSVPSFSLSHTSPSFSCKIWGLGGDGTVSANKNTVKIIGNHTNLFVQAYFDYDSKKSRGLTISHLRFSDAPIHSAYLVEKADICACHNPVYLHKYNMVEDLKDGGIFLLNCHWKQDSLYKKLPGQVKSYLAKHKIRLFIIDALQIGKEIGTNGKTSTILQAALFKIMKILPLKDAKEYMKKAALKSYQTKGEKVLEMNYTAIERGMDEVFEIPIPEQWIEENFESLKNKVLPDKKEVTEFVKNIQHPILDGAGNDLPVSAFLPYVDGSFPSGSTAHERRNISTEIPTWHPEHCIQCGRCAFVCPHAVIRVFALTEEELAKAPKNISFLPLNGMKNLYFTIAISKEDCTGCGSCVGVCPGKGTKKALEMIPIKEQDGHQDLFDYCKQLPIKTEVINTFRETTVKGSQFKQPLLEFSGACSGCGETPYAKLLTQLFGEDMYIANATGCSSIWANSSPSTAYCTAPSGEGPAWSNSLFEDAAEFGYGMLLAQKSIRNNLKSQIKNFLLTSNELNSALKEALENYLATFDDRKENRKASELLINTLEHSTSPIAKFLLSQKSYLALKSFWVFGGDGWAYDIGFGGLDHVLSSTDNINIVVFDTEVYSNTGGQASKATPKGACAKFATDGKLTNKKNLAAMALTYGTVYVAQIAMGADYNQTIKAFQEAEAYPGPSLVICYSPCIAHGIKNGMGSAQAEEAKAVKSGYYHLFRFNPALDEPFQLDSKEPELEYEDFLNGELRYLNLKKADPEKAKSLFSEAATYAKQSYLDFVKLKNFYNRKETI